MSPMEIFGWTLAIVSLAILVRWAWKRAGEDQTALRADDTTPLDDLLGYEDDGLDNGGVDTDPDHPLGEDTMAMIHGCTVEEYATRVELRDALIENIVVDAMRAREQETRELEDLLALPAFERGQA